MSIAIAGAPVDMTNIQLNNLQFAGDSIYNGNLVRVDAGGGNFDDIQGDGFAYSGGGYGGYGGGMGNYDPVGGTVTGLTEVMGNTMIMTVTGFSKDAVSFFGDFRNHNTIAVANDLFAGDDQITGSSGPDTLDGFGGTNTIIALDGNDLIIGGDGANNVNGNRGEDTIMGNSKVGDTLLGGQGNDLIDTTKSTAHNYDNGNLGNDTIHGADAGDTLRGGQGDDVIFGGAGADWISGDRGNNTLTGGGGADTFHAGLGVDVVTDFHLSEGDRVQIDPGVTFTVTQSGADVRIDLAGGTEMVLQNNTVAALGDPSGWIIVA
jgi:serralysin